MKNSRWHFGIIILTPFFLLVIVRVFFHFNGLYGQDAHRYFQFTEELEAYFKNGTPTGDFRWPVLYSLFALVLKLILHIPATWSLQLLSTVALSVSGWYVYKILMHKGTDPQSSFWATLLFFLACPQLMVGAVLCMSDMLGMMWLVLAWYHYFNFIKRREVVNAIMVAFFSSLAIFSRYPVVFLIAFPISYTFLILLREKRPLLPFFILAAFLPAIPEWFLQNTSQSVGGSYLLNHWSPLHLLTNVFQTIDGVQHYRFINLIYISYPFWHPAFLLSLGLFAILNLKKLSPPYMEMVLWLSVFIYLFFLGGIPLQNRRFFLPAVPLILIGMAPILKNVFTGVKLIPSIAVILLLQLTISGWYFQEYWQINRFERELAGKMQSYNGARLYAFYWDTALKSYCPDFQFHNLWEHRYQDFQSGDLLLFDAEGLQEQWKGTTVMENWDYISSHYSLKVKESWPNGWKLYEIR